jgi:hypothetical protein
MGCEVGGDDPRVGVFPGRVPQRRNADAHGGLPAWAALPLDRRRNLDCGSRSQTSPRTTLAMTTSANSRLATSGHQRRCSSVGDSGSRRILGSEPGQPHFLSNPPLQRTGATITIARSPTVATRGLRPRSSRPVVRSITLQGRPPPLTGRTLDGQMRLYFDSNSATEDGRYWLSLPRTLRDLQLLGIELEEGMAVTLYMDDPDEAGRPGLLLVDAIVEKDGAEFVARADERTWRHETLQDSAV